MMTIQSLILRFRALMIIARIFYTHPGRAFQSYLVSGAGLAPLTYFSSQVSISQSM